MIRILLILLASFTLICCNKSKRTTLTLAVASNMQFAMVEIINVFEVRSNLSCDVVVSSSGKLTAQIKEGAPFDVFISADMKYPQSLYEFGLTKDPPKVYAYGKLVIWSTSEKVEPSIEILQSPVVRHIAIPNPKTAPYGAAAVEVLRTNEILESLHDKLVYGESLSQTNQFILSRSAEVGFTSKSVVLSNQIPQKGKWVEVDQNQYSPLAQGIILMDNEQSSLSKQFFDFLFSLEGKTILEKYGYEVEKQADKPL